MELTDAIDPRRAEVRVEWDVARAEVAASGVNRATAEQWAAIADIIGSARRSPEVFVDPELAMRPRERVEFAERAAVADVAVRLGQSEPTVRRQAFDAETLRSRAPRFWLRFRDGEVAPAKARCAAELARSLPDDPGAAAAFDEAICGIAQLPPARFRARARVLRERIHAVPLVERVRAATETRGVWVDNDVDGMAHLTLRVPAEVAHTAFARIDAAARSLHRDADEERTLAQLRADLCGDLLTAGSTDRAIPTAAVAVAVTVPVLTLLGHDDAPGTLDGYGPIDAETARRLAAHAPSFTRLLVHPVSSAVLDVDRTTYRVPADLKRTAEIRDGTCTFSGCGRLARTSDLDHIVDWQHGGATRLGNLTHLCRHHHRVKHMTRWRVRPPAAPDEHPTWTSPTGHAAPAQPPPF